MFYYSFIKIFALKKNLICYCFLFLSVTSCERLTKDVSVSLENILIEESVGFRIDRTSIIASEGGSFLYNFRFNSNPFGDVRMYFCFPSEHFSLFINNVRLEKQVGLSLDDVACSGSSLDISNLENFSVLGPLIINSANWNILYSAQGFVVEDDVGDILDSRSYVLHSLQSVTSEYYSNLPIDDYNVTIFIQDNDQEDFLIRDLDDIQILENGVERLSHLIRVTEVSRKKDLDFYFCIDESLLNLYVNNILLSSTSSGEGFSDDACEKTLLGPVVVLANLSEQTLDIELEAVNDEEAGGTSLTLVAYYAFLKDTFESFGTQKTINFVVLDDDLSGTRLIYEDNFFTLPLTVLEGDTYQLEFSLDTFPGLLSNEDFLEFTITPDSPTHVSITPNTLRFDRVERFWNVPQKLEVQILENIIVEDVLETGFFITANPNSQLSNDFYLAVNNYYSLRLLDNDIPSWGVSPQNITLNSSSLNFSFLLNSSTSISTSVTSPESMDLYFCHSSELDIMYEGVALQSVSSLPSNFFCPITEDVLYGYVSINVLPDTPLNLSLDVVASNFDSRESCNEFQYIYLFGLTENLLYSSLSLPSIQIRKEVAPFDRESQDGTFNHPYLVSNPVELQRISCNLGAHYQLQNNIDLMLSQFWSDDRGFGFSPIGIDERPDIDLFQGNVFSGVFDGNNYSIENLYIVRNEQYVGLFSILGDSSEVYSLHLANAEISACGYVGILAGVSLDSQVYNISIVNSLVTTHSLCSNEKEYFGSIIGDKKRGDLHDVRIENTIINAPLADYVASLTGRNFLGSIYNVFSSAVVFGSNYVAGLVAVNGGSLYELTFLGNVSSPMGSNFIGGAVATNLGLADIERTNIFANVSGSINIGGFIGYNQGDLRENYVSSEIFSFGTSMNNVGGFIGYDENGLHHKNFGHANISILADHITLVDSLGGYFGRTDGSMIEESVFLGTIFFERAENLTSLGVTSLGGFGGQAENTLILNSYGVGVINMDDITSDVSESNLRPEYHFIGSFLGSGTQSRINTSYASIGLNLDYMYNQEPIGFQGRNELTSVEHSYWSNDINSQYPSLLGSDVVSQRSFSLLRECAGESTLIPCFNTYQEENISQWNTSVWDFMNANLLPILRNTYPAEQVEYLEEFMIQQDELAAIQIKCGLPLQDCTSIIGETSLIFSHINASTTITGGVISWRLFPNRNDAEINFSSSNNIVMGSSLSVSEFWSIEATVTYESLQLKKIFIIEVSPGLLFEFTRSSLIIDNTSLPLAYREGSGSNEIPQLSWRNVPDNANSIIVLVESSFQDRIYLAQFTNRTSIGLPFTTSGSSWVRTIPWSSLPTNLTEEEILTFHIYIFDQRLNINANTIGSSTQVEQIYLNHILEHQTLTSVLTSEIVLASSELHNLYNSEVSPSPISTATTHTFLIDQMSDYIGSITEECSGDNRFPRFDIQQISRYTKSVVLIIEDLNIRQDSGVPWVLLNAHLTKETELFSDFFITSGASSDSEFDPDWVFGLNSWAFSSIDVPTTSTRGWAAPCSRVTSLVSARIYALNIALDNATLLDNITMSEFENRYQENILPSRENAILILARGSM